MKKKNINNSSGSMGRRWSKREKKMLRTGAALFTILLILASFIICSSLHRRHGAAPKQPKIVRPAECTFGGRSDFCEIEGDLRIDPDSATIYQVVQSETYAMLAAGNKIRSPPITIKPYPRNGDDVAMGQIREWSVKMVPENHQNLPRCSGGDQIHDAPGPGVLFSAGAYFGNYFHAFTDVLVALFVTAHPFNREVVLLVTDGKPVHVDKFKTLFNGLSRYPTIDIDKAGRPAGKPRCFSRLTIGLKGRDGKELSINSEQSEYTMADFKQFLRSTYSLRRTTAVKLQTGDNTLIPRLLIISREKTRIVTNVGEIENLARELGYRVTVGELDDDVSKTAEFTNGFDAMMGVHGAGLTNMVFLPEDAVVIQVVPFAADWVSGAYFGEPAEKMGLRYLEYKIGREESSLMRQYPPDDVVFTDPASFRWEEFSPIYLQNQNVTVDVTRFKPLLVKGLELLHE